jgi:hypothetical protein
MALAEPPAKREDLLNAANLLMGTALLAYPVAAKLYDVSFMDPNEREKTWSARKLARVAAVRALCGATIPKSIQTNDLLSPYTGKPLTYSFDGKQIAISVAVIDPEGATIPQTLKIPPDNISSNPSHPNIIRQALNRSRMDGHF